MIEVRVALAPPYQVGVGPGALAALSTALTRHERVVVVTDENVERLHATALGEYAHAPRFVLSAGEESKSFAQLERLLEFMTQHSLERSSALVAFGGGVVGDLAGLAASLYQRGIACAQAPTTLVAQVDSSVGGKTAINLRTGKNLVGTFHQPVRVLADTTLLATLDEREYRAGLGEVLKTALIEGEHALQPLERDVRALSARDPEVLARVVASCVRTKASIVVSDPHERGERKVLNLGHTFAHAIEHAAGYGRVPHGIAVAVGLALAARAAQALGKLSEIDLPQRIETLLQALELPSTLAQLRTQFDCALEPAHVSEAMRRDKKNVRGRVRLVLPLRVGVVMRDVEVDGEFLSEFLARA